MQSSHCLHAIDSVTSLYRVQIYLHDALLAPQQFNQCREVGFKALSHPCTARPQKYVLCRLLCYGAGTNFLTACGILPCSMLYLLEVEAVVKKESRIFAAHNSHWHTCGHLLKTDPLMLHARRMAVGYLLNATDNHQRRNINGQKLICDDCKDSGNEKRHYHYSYEIPYLLPHYSLCVKKRATSHNRPLLYMRL